MEELAKAEAPDTEAGELAELALSVSVDVRDAVARHPNIDNDTQMVLAEDAEEEVVAAIIRRSDVTSEVLTKIAEEHLGDEDWPLCLVAQHPKTPTRTLERIAENTLVGEVYVARNPAAPPELLHHLIDHPEPWLRVMIANNPAAMDETLELLAADEHEHIRVRAAERLLQGRSDVDDRVRDVVVGLLKGGQRHTSLEELVTAAKDMLT